MTEGKSTWRFPRFFWTANVAELFERAAYYGTFITLTLYLTDEIGFTDPETGWVTAFFAAGIYLLPTFTGALSDKLGFRFSLLVAFGMLATGYACLGAWQTKPTALLSLGLILLGGSFIKPIITGTVAIASDEYNRARAFSIFYMMVNIGSFTGKTFARPLRVELGLEYINYYSSIMALIFYKAPPGAGEGKPFMASVRGLGKVLGNFRFMALILIVAGFWAIQGQLYATMPKYLIRMVGENASPEWLANINPLVVVTCVVPITQLVRLWKPVNSINVALGLIPFTALIIAFGPWAQSIVGTEIMIRETPIVLFGHTFAKDGIQLHHITLVACIGIGMQGLSECFLSPKFLEYASKQAPRGEEGLYMGYSHLTTFFAWLFGFAISGYLLDWFCPDPKTLKPAELATAYDHAHYIWYVFAGIGAFSFVLMMIFRVVTNAIDKKKAAQ
jgi:dipeptide/tripeptide permease